MLVLFPYHLKNMPSNCHIFHHNSQIYVFPKRGKKDKINLKAKIEKNSSQLEDTRGKVCMRYMTRYATRHGHERSTAKLQDLFVRNL